MLVRKGSAVPAPRGPGLAEGVDFRVRAGSTRHPVVLRNCIKDHCRKDSPTYGSKPRLTVRLRHLHVMQDHCLEVTACSPLPGRNVVGRRLPGPRPP